MTLREVEAMPVERRDLCGLAWLDGLLWWSDGTLDQIVAVGPETGDVAERLTCRGVRTGLTAADEGRRLVPVADLSVMGNLVVFASHRGRRLGVVDPPAERVVEVVPVAGRPTGLTGDGQHLRCCDSVTSHLRAGEMTPVGEEVTV